MEGHCAIINVYSYITVMHYSGNYWLHWSLILKLGGSCVHWYFTWYCGNGNSVMKLKIQWCRRELLQIIIDNSRGHMWCHWIPNSITVWKWYSWKWWTILPGWSVVYSIAFINLDKCWNSSTGILQLFRGLHCSVVLLYIVIMLQKR